MGVGTDVIRLDGLKGSRVLAVLRCASSWSPGGMVESDRAGGLGRLAMFIVRFEYVGRYRRRSVMMVRGVLRVELCY